MSGWQKVIAGIASDIEGHFDELKSKLGKRRHRDSPLEIQAYRGFGNTDKLYLKGRVLIDKGITMPDDNDTIWENLVNMYKRFESDEIPYAKVAVRFQGNEQVVTADEEGFFEAWMDPEVLLDPEKLWWEVELELVEPESPEKEPVKAIGYALVPPPQAQFGVISDIDDTVIQTGTGHLLRMARTVFLGNARTRLPFKGAAAFYRALFEGNPGGVKNPLFYVSSSPWNLYDLLSEFFHLQDIPIGPVLFLRDWGITEEEILPIENRAYKLETCRKIMDLYQELSFILIGDSSQEDPEIYRELIQLYPERVMAVYIRNVSTDLERPEEIRKLAEEIMTAGSVLILADDTVPMAKHAAEKGWINPDALPSIEVEKQIDEAPPSPVEELLGQEEEAPTVVMKGDEGEVEVKEPDEEISDEDETATED